MGQCMRYIVEDSGAFPLLEGRRESHLDCWNIQTRISGFESVGLQDDNVALKIQLFTTQSSLINYLRVTRKHSYLIVNVHEPHSIGHVIRKHERGYESEHST